MCKGTYCYGRRKQGIKAVTDVLKERLAKEIYLQFMHAVPSMMAAVKNSGRRKYILPALFGRADGLWHWYLCCLRKSKENMLKYAKRAYLDSKEVDFDD